MSFRPRPLAATVPSLLVLVLSACATWDPDNQARDRAMAVLECEEVTMVKLADNRYQGTGCGGRIEILCSSGHLEPVCLAVRPRGDEHVSGIAEVGSGGEAAAERGEDEVAAGEVAATAERAAGEDAAGAQDAVGEGPSGPDAEDEGPVATARPIESHIRSGLDARRDDVLACTGRSATVVRARYALDGSVSLTLAGDLEGSPEEGCVRAALGGVRVEGGHEGVVMHLLRR